MQTAGTQENFELSHIPNPYRIARKIIDLHERAVAEEEKREAREIGKTIALKNKKEKKKKGEIPKTRRDVRRSRLDEERRRKIRKSAESAMEEMRRDVADFERQARTDMGGTTEEPKNERTPGTIPTGREVRGRAEEPEKKPKESHSGPTDVGTMRDKSEISKDDLKKGGEIDL